MATGEISLLADRLSMEAQNVTILDSGLTKSLRFDQKESVVSITDIGEPSENSSGDETDVDTVLLQHGPRVPESEESFFDLLEHALLIFGESIAATDAVSGKSIQYNELRFRSDRLGRALCHHRSKPIGLCMEPSIDFLVAVVSLARHGMTYVALDPSLPEDRARHIIRTSGVDTVLCSSRHTRLSHFDKLHIIDISKALEENAASRPVPVTKPCSGNAIAILYTSGSSGVPKGVVLSYRALLNRLLWQWQQNPFKANDVVAAKTRMGFGDSLAETWAPLLVGTPLVYVPPAIITNPSLFLNTMEDFDVSLLILVPSLLQVLLRVIEDEGRELVALRQVVSSGETLTMETCEQFFRVLPRCELANYYGATETMADATGIVFSSLDDVRKTSYKKHVSAGKVVNNSTIFLRGSDGEGIGELIVTGFNLATGYVPSSMEKRFVRAAELEDLPREVDGDQLCFKTGDRGKFHDGNLVLLGRNDRQIKIAGNRIDLNEVEDVISGSLVFVTQPVVLAHDGQVLAFYEEHETPDWITGQQRIAKWLPGYAIPRFVSVEEIPHLQVSGKVDQRALVEHLCSRSPKSRAPQSELTQESKILSQVEEQKLKALTQALHDAGFDCPESTDLLATSFFLLGGTSLNALLVLQRLQKQRIHVSLEDFFSVSTFRDLLHVMSVWCGQQTIEKEMANNALANKQICDENGWTFVPIDSQNLEEAVVLLGANFINEQLTMFRTEDFMASKPRLQEEATIVFRAQLAYFVRQRDEEHVSFGLRDSQGRLVAVSFSYAEDCSLNAKGAVLDKTSMLVKGPLLAKALTLFADEPLIVKGLHIAKNMLAVKGSSFIKTALLNKALLLGKSGVLAKGPLIAKAKVAAFLDDVQTSVISELKHDGHSNILFGLATAVDHQLVPNPAARVQAMMALERHVLKTALERGFDTVFSINSSPLTQDAADLLGYDTARTIGNLKSIKDDAGQSAFPSATDNAVVKVQYKVLRAPTSMESSLTR